MSSSHYECNDCGEISFGGNMDGDQCPLCGGDTRHVYDTSGAWDDPDREKREWENR